jgi:predicted dehydrogenase
MDRRTFMKKSTLVTGGVIIAPSLDAVAYIDGGETIRVGLIGCGGRGTGAAAQALSTVQDVKLVAMADAFEDRLNGCLEHLNKQSYMTAGGQEKSMSERVEVIPEHRFVGFDAYMKVLPLVDVVILTTPPGFRPMHFEAAVNAGKHIFTEKPMAVDAPGVRRVLAAAEKAKSKKLNVVVGLQRRYQKIYTEWVEALQGGAIGDIVTSHVYWNSGGVWTMPREAGQTEMEYQMRNWYYFNWLCGDHICEQHIHNLDVSNWVKQDYPTSAYGMGGRRMRTGKDTGEIFDHHFIEYEYKDGSRMYSQCRHWNGVKHSVTESFQGTSGNAPKPGVIKTSSGYSLMKYNDKRDPNPYQVEHDVLFEAIAKGDYKFSDAEHGAKSTLTAIMGRMATYSGQMLTWDEAMNSEVDIMPKVYDWNAVPPVTPDENGNYPIAIPGVTKVY